MKKLVLLAAVLLVALSIYFCLDNVQPSKNRPQFPVTESRIIDLNDKHLKRIRPDTKAAAILANEFIETGNANTINPKYVFQNMPDSMLLSDRNIPRKNIKYFYGIENGKLKAGPLDIFHDSTTVIPIRNKQPAKAREVRVDEKGGCTFVGTDDGNREASEYNLSELQLYYKILFADEEGHAVFANNIQEMSPEDLNRLGDYLREHPSYVVMVDNGMFSHYLTGDSASYSLYIEQSGLKNIPPPQNVFILGY